MSENEQPSSLGACPHKVEPRGCYRVRCQLGRECIESLRTDATLTLRQRINDLTEQHGSLRAAAKALNLDVGYLSRLASGEREWPSDHVLGALGMQRRVVYEYARVIDSPEGGETRSGSTAKPQEHGAAGTRPENQPEGERPETRPPEAPAAAAVQADERAAFETYMAQMGYHDFDLNEFGDYRNCWVQWPRNVWNASRAALASTPAQQPAENEDAVLPEAEPYWKFLGCTSEQDYQQFLEWKRERGESA